MWWFQQGLSGLPVALVLCLALSFVLPFVTAVLLRHVDPLVPYISDSGAEPPERCLFGLLLNICTGLGLGTVYVRYKQVCAWNAGNSGILRLNRTSLALGCASCLGLCLIANFQKSVLYSVHVLGAVLAFGMGALYMLGQTLLEFRAQPEPTGRALPWARLALLLWAAGSAGSMLVASVLLGSGIYGPNLAQKLHWDPQDRGYTPHLVSTISEWSLALAFLSFFLTFIQDFQELSLSVVVTLQGSAHPAQGFGNEEQGLLVAGSI